MNFFTIVCCFIIGITIGYKFFPKKYIMLNSKIQLLCISLILFSLGISMGCNPNFFSDLKIVGIKAFILALSNILGSIIMVLILRKIIKLDMK